MNKNLNERQIQKELLKFSLKRFSQLDSDEKIYIMATLLPNRDVWRSFAYNKEKTIPICRAENEANMKAIEVIKSTLKAHDIFLLKLEEEYENALNEVASIELRLKIARDEAEKIKAKIKAANKFHAELESQISEHEKEIAKGNDFLEKAERIYLIHPSASLKMIQEHQVGTFIATKNDAKLCSNLIIDGVFDIEDSPGFLETYQTNRILREVEESEKKSILEYCEMVLYYCMESDAKIIPLFADKRIHDILKQHGFEF